MSVKFPLPLPFLRTKRAARFIGVSEITTLLDKVEDERGKQSTQQLLAFLSRAFAWYATRHNDFRSPFVRRAGRAKPRERAGKRTSTEGEIRDPWVALAAGANDLPSCYPAYVRRLLLTALRRSEAGRGSWSEIATVYRDNIDGYSGDAWTIPARRMKNGLAAAVPLTPAVLALIGGKPKDAKAWPYLFSTVGGIMPFGGYSKAKKALDERIAKVRRENGREPMPGWQLHDLRRTAKTLMARAGVRPAISERVLSHAIEGVEGVYDCYNYLPKNAMRSTSWRSWSIGSSSTSRRPRQPPRGPRRPPATSHHRPRSDDPCLATHFATLSSAPGDRCSAKIGLNSSHMTTST